MTQYNFRIRDGVAHPNPLGLDLPSVVEARLAALRISADLLSKHRDESWINEDWQLVVTDATAITRGRDFNVLAYRTWRVGDVATKHHLIRGGLGWGGLPASLIREDLQSGRLVHLDLEAYEQGEYPIYAIRKLAHPPGPAAAWMVEAFRSRLGHCPSRADFVELPFVSQPGAIAAE